jgi:hypothetical protein
MLQRNLLYTGATRGKRLVVLVGQNKAIAIAGRKVSGRRRWSKLDEWLRLGASRTSFDASKAGWGTVSAGLTARGLATLGTGGRPLTVPFSFRPFP